jgi:hypothetical protein
VVSVEISAAEGTYTAGEVLDFQVKFSDQVFVTGMPTLLLNIDNQANYSSGHETDTLIFRYISTKDDVIDRLDWVLDPSTDSAIVCTDDCSIQNANGVDADARFHDSINEVALVQPLSINIELNPSTPHIVTVATVKEISPYCHPLCSYTVGEEIDIVVTFDRPVAVLGDEILLLVDVGNDARGIQAIFDPFQSTEFELVFVYTVQEGHSTNNGLLNYVCSSTHCTLQLGEGSMVKGAASQPTVDANLSLPQPSDYGISDDESHPIRIDTSEQPKVTVVSSITPNGSYSPGDVVEIVVEFSKTVIVYGEPFLMLNVGIEQAGIATYKAGTGSSTLVFEYHVGRDHSTNGLDYVDAHSLYVGYDGVDYGYIRQASTHSTIDAILDLPFPSTEGSLSLTSNIAIDSRQPHITSISATSGEYATGDVILIQVQLSQPITVYGHPSLLLETGVKDRIATYDSQLDDYMLQFVYIVQLGDTAARLDYWSDDMLLPSSSMSINLNGGWIKRSSANPLIDADLHLNPVHGFLDGNLSNTVNEGVADFRDIKIGHRGRDFKIRYKSSSEMEVSEVVKVDTSNEFEVQGSLDNRDPGDLYGSSVAIYNNLITVGAPGRRNPTPEVQVLSVYSETSTIENEVQIITTNLNRTEAIISVQEFGTCADADEVVQGTFELAYKVGGYAFASNVVIDSDATADQLQSVLEAEWNMFGAIDTSRLPNYDCQSENSWKWSVSFIDSSNGIGILETNGDSLIGNGAYISEATIIRNTDMLSGSFSIRNPTNGKTSRQIPYRAPADFIKEAIESDLSIAINSVQVENIDSSNAIPELGRRWTLYFSHHVGDYGEDVNIPQLQVSGETLSGKDALVSSQTVFEGRGILSGSFAMSFRGSNPSDPVSFDSSEEEIVEALESLDSINSVTVSNRREFVDEAGKSGFSWTITFLSVNYLTEYGWLMDPGGMSNSGNLPTLEIANHLIGWNAAYLVKSETGRGKEDTQAQWMEQQMGDDGVGSGIVEVFANVGEAWRKEATLLASDHNSHDAFGTSVSISHDFLLVGAPSKEVDGLPEQQRLTCNGPASGGFFSTEFRGFHSSPIPYDATLQEIQTIFVGIYGETSQLHSLPRLLLSSDSTWDGDSSGFCTGGERSIIVTFLTPDGGGISTVEHRSGNVEELTIHSEHLVGGTISLIETRAGTIAPMGKDLHNSHPTGKQAGSAYLFKRHVSCNYCNPIWTQVQKFTPLDGLDDPTEAAKFGWSTVLVPESEHGSMMIVVGSPGFNQESGKVYIFNDVQGSMVLFDTLTDQNWNHEGMKGGRFGSSIDANHDTILVGAPFHSNGKGAVYVFQRPETGQGFLASQAIYGDDIEEGDRFGHSLSLSSNKAVLCAPYKSVEAIHFVRKRPKLAHQVGSCYVYSQRDQSSAFKLDQRLTPSNVLPGDHFGWSVSLSDSKILVGQVEEYSSKLAPPRPVQRIRTFCKTPPCNVDADSTFRLRWMNDKTSHLTPYLPPDVSTKRLREAIEQSLHSGQVTVSRSVLPDKDGGNSWHVTFDSFEPFFRDESQIPLLRCDASATSSLVCDVHVENEVPLNIRSKTHLFDFDEASMEWTEQAFLFPTSTQRKDLLGTSVALDGHIAVAGAPNRELLNVNSGAAFVYDTGFTEYHFQHDSQSVTEGDSVDITVTRTSSDRHQLVSFRTIDRNAENALQHYVNELYSLRSKEMIPYDKTSIDLLTGNNALGRSQYYGSDERRSLFVQGQYDFQGISDYELLSYEGQFKAGDSTVTTVLKTNDDSILEKPNENVTIQITLRGMFASQLGRLKADVYIEDNGDGKTEDSSKVHHQLLEGHDDESLSRMGSAVAYDKRAKVVVVGSDEADGLDANGHRLSNVGSVHIFNKMPHGWVLEETLSPPSDATRSNMKFGQSVAIYTPYGRNDTTILIGSPGSASAYVYVHQKDSNSWEHQATLTADTILSPEHRFGGANAIALHDDLAFVGSSLMEAVYVFRRSYVKNQGLVHWESYTVLRSSHFDYDVYGQGNTVKHVHRQDFGVALAASQRSLLVGAPFADYGNSGSVEIRENVNTDGVDNKGIGKGRVYAFYSQPHVQLITLQSDEIISAGTFRLMLESHLGVEKDISGLIQHDSSTDSIKVALEEMDTVGEVNVEATSSFIGNSYTSSWRVTFLSSFVDEHPILVPQWHGNECVDCTSFKVSVLSTVQPFITVSVIHEHQPFIQEGEMQPRDVTSSDLFGSALALDKSQAIIGSVRSSAKTRTTWSFETGNLNGWSATGTAFRYQPTFGDNSYHRPVYEYGIAASRSTGDPQSSRLVGRYYIGTYEKRPRDHDKSYQRPSKEFPLGSVQGDEPTGTLTSDPFLIRGDSISFLVGGGCNHLNVYVELLVDGFPSLRATGKCNERMDKVEWDVSDFKTRAGQIRVVDQSSEKWGHIVRADTSKNACTSLHSPLLSSPILER